MLCCALLIFPGGIPGSSSCLPLRKDTQAGPRHRLEVQSNRMYPIDTRCSLHSLGGQAEEGFPVSTSWKALVSVFLKTKEGTDLI